MLRLELELGLGLGVGPLAGYGDGDRDGDGVGAGAFNEDGCCVLWLCLICICCSRFIIQHVQSVTIYNI